MILVILIIVMLIVIGFIIFSDVPIGHEDEKGFHRGEKKEKSKKVSNG
jgi:hypothetical protein